MKKDWETKTLGEVCEYISRGISPKYTEKKGTMVLNQKCIRDHNINFDLARFHDSETKKVSPEKIIQKGDVLINSTGTGTLGRVAQVSEDILVTVDSHITVVRPNKEIFDQRFFAWTLFNIETEIEESGAGASGQTELARETVKKFIVSYPLDKTEQKRIVKILDEKFEVIEELKKITEQQIVDARELFGSRLEEVFKAESASHSLQEVCEITSSKRVYASDYVKSGVPFYRTKEIKELAHNKSPSTELFIDEQKYAEIKKRFGAISEGDLLLTAIGTIGEMYIVQKTDEFYFKDGNVLWLKNIHSTLTEYLKYALECYVKEIQSLSIGAAYKALTIEKLKKHMVPVPSLMTQRQVVRDLDELSEKTKGLEAIFRRKIASLEELKKSYLHEAFAGNL